jgi:hypothetical protein
MTVKAFFFHAMIQAVLAYLFAGIWLLWQIPTVFFISHFIIDFLKEDTARLCAPKNADGKPIAAWKFWSILIDQLLHVAVIVLLVIFPEQIGMILGEPYWSVLIGQTVLIKSLIVLIGLVLAVYAGGVLVGILVEPFLQEIRGNGESLKQEQRGLENGGKRIGQLERTLIFFFILTGQAASVGFLITAKSVFRFGELKDAAQRKEAEYIIIGTMLSFTWALIVAWCAHYLLQVI